MDETTNRRGRKDDLGRALAGVLVCLALAAVPAQAGTGGASATPGAGSASGAGGLVFSTPMRLAGATWYGPGLYGNHTACGQTLRADTIGVAHRTLPCGTVLKLAYHGRQLVTQVIDRGPYTEGNDFDLTNGARRALGFEGVDRLRYAVAVGHRNGSR